MITMIEVVEKKSWDVQYGETVKYGVKVTRPGFRRTMLGKLLPDKPRVSWAYTDHSGFPRDNGGEHEPSVWTTDRVRADWLAKQIASMPEPEVWVWSDYGSAL